jgi:hypothetical protein
MLPGKLGGIHMRRIMPLLVLFVLAPLVAEVLLGATLSCIGGLLPVSLLYGGGAVLIRELARRRGGWGSIALLGAAYGIVEEGLAIQSLFNPNLFNAGMSGGGHSSTIGGAHGWRVLHSFRLWP